MEISYLADHPEHIPDLARLLLDHWRPYNPDQTLEERIAKLHAHLNRDRLPIALAALSGPHLLGIAALRVHDLDDRPDLTPWLGGVYVKPAFRRQGVGSALTAAVESKAQDLGFREIYLFTLDREDWYASLGWSTLESFRWRGHPGIIMRKDLRIAVHPEHEVIPDPSSHTEGGARRADASSPG